MSCGPRIDHLPQFEAPCRRLAIPEVCKDDFLKSLELYLVDHLNGRGEELKNLELESTTKKLDNMAYKWLKKDRTQKQWWISPEMSRSKPRGETPWKDSNIVHDISKLLYRLNLLEDSIPTTTLLNSSFSSNEKFAVEQSWSSQIAPTANMISSTTAIFQPKESAEVTDSRKNYNSPFEDDDAANSAIETTNDRSSDDDYDETPRKSSRQSKPSNKAIQGGRAVSSEGLSPVFDRGRFPMQRRKERSDKGISKKRQASVDNAPFGDPAHKKRLDEDSESTKTNTDVTVTTSPENSVQSPLEVGMSTIGLIATRALTLNDIMQTSPDFHEIESSALTNAGASPCFDNPVASYELLSSAHLQSGKYDKEIIPISSSASGNDEGPTKLLDAHENYQPSREACALSQAIPCKTVNVADVSGSMNITLTAQPPQLVSAHGAAKSTTSIDNDNAAGHWSPQTPSPDLPQPAPDAPAASKSRTLAEPAVASSEEKSQPTIQIRYFLLQRRERRELETGLRGLRVEELFDKVSSAADLQNVTQIHFRFFRWSNGASISLWRASVKRGSPADLDLLREDSWDAIKRDMRESGAHSYRVDLEPEGETPEGAEREVVAADPKDQFKPW